MEKAIGKVDLSKITDPLLIQLKESGLITEEGIRVQGMGILIRKLEKLEETTDTKVALKLHFIEKKLEKFLDRT